MTKPGKDLIVVERSVKMQATINKGSKDGGAEKTVTKILKVHQYPADVPLSRVTVRTSGTFNMGNYNSIHASVEIEDSTLANREARKLLVRALGFEALEYNKQLAHEVAQALFNSDLPGMIKEG